MEAYDIIDSAIIKYDLLGNEAYDLFILKELYGILDSSSLYQLSEEIIDTLKSYLVYEDGVTTSFVKGILTMYGYHFPPEYIKSSSSGAQGFVINATNVNESSQEIISVFPNPSKGSISLDCSNCEIETEFTIYLYDLTGKSVFKNTFNSKSVIQINLLDKPSGMYFYFIISKDEVVQTGKFVLEN